MLRLILEIACAIILIALAILLFIHVLPWIVIVLSVLVLGGLLHHWSHDNGKGFNPFSWWPWRKDQGGNQPTA
jgi:fatty acid desaturase